MRKHADHGEISTEVKVNQEVTTLKKCRLNIEMNGAQSRKEMKLKLQL